MDKLDLQKILNLRFRKLTVVVVALAILLVGGLPMMEQFGETKRRIVESQEAIRTVSAQAAELPARRQLAAEHDLRVDQELGIHHTRAVEFRDECLRLVRQHQCRAQNVSEGRALRQPWHDSVQPLAVSNSIVKEKPKYEIMTGSLNLTIVGQLRHLVALAEDLRKLNDFFVPVKLNLQQFGSETELKLEVEMAMVQLVKAAPPKKD